MTDVAVEDAIEALLEHWDDVSSELGPEAVSELRRLVRELGGPGRAAAVGQNIDILAQRLPARHPVRRALVKGDMSAPAVIDWDTLAAALFEQAGLSADDDDDPERGAAPSADEILRIVRARLLAAPALSEQQVGQRGTDPADAGLIRLTRPDGGHQSQAFQFAPDGGPLPVVRAINHVLHAARGPDGVDRWWLSRTAGWTGGPRNCLGRVPDGDLLGERPGDSDSEV